MMILNKIKKLLHGKRYLLSIDEIAWEIYNSMTDSEISLVRGYIHPDLMSRHHSTTGRYIRNYYHLWDAEHPLTKKWHDDRRAHLTNFIMHGIDHHPNHPDRVSCVILMKVWELVNCRDHPSVTPC